MSINKTDTEKYCAYCEHACTTFQEDKMLCDVKGIVSAGFKCRKFVYDPQKRNPSKKHIVSNI